MYKTLRPGAMFQFDTVFSIMNAMNTSIRSGAQVIALTQCGSSAAAKARRKFRLSDSRPASEPEDCIYADTEETL